MMKKIAYLWLVFAATIGVAQNPQSQNAPIFSANSKYVNGVAPGYWPTQSAVGTLPASSGLVLNVGAGTANCSNTIVTSVDSTLTMTAGATNYVYLNSASNCTLAVKTSTFSGTDIPIAIVVAGSSSITSISDVRTIFTVQPSTTTFQSGLVAGTGVGAGNRQGTANDVAGVLYASTSGGTAQAQTVTLSPAISSYQKGLSLSWSPTNSNIAAAPTLAVNSLSGINITKCGTSALVAGDIVSSVSATVIYDGTEFVLQNPQAILCGAGAGSGLSGTAGYPVFSTGSGTTATSQDPTQGSLIVPPVNGSKVPTPLTIGPNSSYTLPLSGYFTGMHNFGTSISAGYGLPTSGSCTGSDVHYSTCNWTYKLNQKFSTPFTAGSTWVNNSLSNDEVCDTVKKYFYYESPVANDTMFRTLEFGTNEALHHTFSAYFSTAKLCADALLSRASVTFVKNGSNTTAATNWTVDSTTYPANYALTSTTNGAVQTFDMTGYSTTANTNPHVYVWYAIYDPGGSTTGATFTVAMSGTTTQTINAYTYAPVATSNGATSSIGYVDMGTTTTSNPTVTVTQTSTGQVSIIGVGAAPGYVSAPITYVAGAARNMLNQSSLSSNNPDLNSYNELWKREVRKFQGQGASGLYWVNWRNCWLATPGQLQLAGGIHPSDAGTTAIANCFTMPVAAEDVQYSGFPFNAPNVRTVTGSSGGYISASDDYVMFTYTGGTVQLPLPAQVQAVGPHVITLDNNNTVVTLAGYTGQGGTAVGAQVWPYQPIQIISDVTGTRWDVVQPITAITTTSASMSVGAITNELITTETGPIALTLPTNIGPKKIYIHNTGTSIITFSGATSGNAYTTSPRIFAGQDAWLTSTGSGEWDVSTMRPASVTTASLGGSSAVAAGACTSVTETLTGVVAFTTRIDSVVPSAYPGDGWNYFAYPSATNTITVKVCNATGASATPGAATYTVYAN